MRTWLIHTATAAVLVAAAAAPVMAQMPSGTSLNLSFDAEGRVNLVAQNVTVREILAEWSRQCGCHVVNAEKLNDGPLTVPVQFQNAAQSDVLESLLRDAAGFVLTPRRAGMQSASLYETIYILATSSAVDNSFGLPYTPDVPMPAPTRGSPDDEIAPVTPVAPDPVGAEAPSGASPSNPFGSRTSSPNVFSTPSRPAPPSAPRTAPGGVTPPPPVPSGAMPYPSTLPYPSNTPPSGVSVPIVPVPPSGQ
jgi:hypothetical protein